MTELEPILAQLRKRGDELKTMGPGRVEVAPVNHLNEVRLLRQCRELLTPVEQLEIRHAMIELESHLHGIVVAPPVAPSSGLFDRWKAILGGGAPVEAGPSLLPPPQSLIDAAEAWVTAELTRGRVEVDVDGLTGPWQNARIAPTD